MKKVKRWRYYCDFCKKSGGSKYHMERHEKACTANPDRDCNMCEYSGGPSALLPDIIKVITDNTEVGPVEIFDGDFIVQFKFKGDATEQSVIEKIKDISWCPACVLAAMRQTGAFDLFPFWEFKKEKDEMFESYNEENNHHG